MELLDFARGPGLQLAVLIFVAGLIWRLLHLYLTLKKTDLSEARQGGEIGGGLRTIFSRFLHHQPFRERTRNGTILAYTIHFGLAIVVFGSAPHILFIGSFSGLDWAPMPTIVIHISAALTLAAFGAMAKVLNALGESWTFRTEGFEATNFGMMAGNVEWQKQATMKLINAAINCDAKLVVLPECGHAYGALRWQGAAMYGKPLPFKVQHISEFLADVISSGRLKIKKVDQTVTFHDPCQVARRGAQLRRHAS